MQGDTTDTTTFSDCLLTDIDDLKEYLVNKFGRTSVPNQPTKNGKPIGEWVYSSVVITVDEPDHVGYVMKKLKKKGFMVSSNKSLIDSAKRNTRLAELVFGGFGMIALIVAVIGIANTMMMSVYEQTREIGIMKVVGCLTKDIRKIFLSEAAVIGVTGGAVGCIMADIVSIFVNKLSVRYADFGTEVSVVTPGLVICSMIVVTLIAVLSAVTPAKRAARLDPLETMRR
jgi:ABC-type antimicrobial peptide transport system permease subunit